MEICRNDNGISENTSGRDKAHLEIHQRVKEKKTLEIHQSYKRIFKNTSDNKKIRDPENMSEQNIKKKQSFFFKKHFKKINLILLIF